MTSIGNLVVEPPRQKKEREEPRGTHLGKLDDDARRRRAAKNARNRSRGGQATHPRGSQSKGRSDGGRRSRR